MSTNDPYTTPARQPNQPQWEFQYRGEVQPVRPTNGLAVAALVLGIVWVFWLGSIMAVIFGHAALSEIKTKGQEGKGLAIAGLVLGYVGVATFTLFVVLPLLLGAGA